MPAITRKPTWTIQPLLDRFQLGCSPEEVDFLRVAGSREHPRYLVGFAVSRRALEAAQRLRFETFNLEFGEGLADSWVTGLDRDPFDAQMQHLVLVERATRAVVGTCRLQTGGQAEVGLGYHSAQEFDLQPLEAVLPQAVEAGRACLHARHRNPTAIVELWQGVKAFLALHGVRYLFGSCSITTRDPLDGWRAMRTLEARGWVHPTLRCPPRTRFACGPDTPSDATPLPKLFSTSCKLGALAVSDPAIDREFGTVDVLVLQDAAAVCLSSLRGAYA